MSNFQEKLFFRRTKHRAVTTTFSKTILPNGIRVLTEKRESTQCVVVGFWLKTGSRDEPIKYQGVSHLIEHLVFKGTKSFSSLDIAHRLEAVGGEINAFTAKEHVCFHTETLKEDLNLCIHVLAELISSALFQEDAVEKEKGVVLQEILMAKDDIEDSVFDNFFLTAFPKSPLGTNILEPLIRFRTLHVKKLFSGTVRYISLIT